MNVIVTAKSNNIDNSILTEMKDKIILKLSRIVEDNSIIRITIDDMNGIKGGMDKLCTMKIEPKKSIPIISMGQARTEDEAFRKSLHKFMKLIMRRKP